MCSFMRKFIFYHEEQKLGFELHGSRGRCSISNRSFVLLNDGKKKGRKRLGVIFKSIGKVLKTVAKIIIAIGAIAELVLFILKTFC